MSHGSNNVTTPTEKYSGNYPSAVKTMLQRGQDPKEMLIEFCRPSCKHWEDKLKRCEKSLRELSNSDPESTCMYPMRDWVTCVEGCVIILNFNEGIMMNRFNQ